MFESFAAAIILAIVGAFALPALSKKTSPGPSDQSPVFIDEHVAFHPKLDLQARVAELEARVAQLEARLEPRADPAAASATTVAVADPVGELARPLEPRPASAPGRSDAQAPAQDPVSEPMTGATMQAAMSPSTITAGPESAPEAATTMAPPLAPAATASPVSQPASEVSYETAEPAASPLPPPPPPVPLRDRLPAPIAALIFGGNLLVKLGVLILFFGLAFLLRYTAERVTVPIELRYASVALVGAGLLAFGWLLRNKRRDYALVLQGAGIGVFYLTTLAAMKLHPLLPPTAGFAFLFAVALLSALLAVLQKAPVLAIVAALEGFAAPVLASTGHNNPLGLFSYLLVLDLGLFAVAWFQAWRVLNVIGAVGTFTLAVAWAQRSYTDDQFGVVQPFLLAFFLLFTAIGLLFARRTLKDAPVESTLPLAARAADTLRRVGRVDSALVFGVPMAGFGLQYLMVRHWEFGPAFAALGFGVFYLVLGRMVFATQAQGLGLLAEAYAIVGVIFGTLTIPLAFEGQWTGAAWAIEAAGMYWLGVRQSRPYARAFAFVVLAGAVFKLLHATYWEDASGHALLGGSVIGPVLVAAGALTMWALYRRARLFEGDGWEAMCGCTLPWLGMAALDMVAWQTLAPMWAAVATAGLASAGFAVAMRVVPALAPVTYGLQTFAVGSFIATLHRPGGDAGEVLASGWQGALAACLIALSVLGSVVFSMLQVRRNALESTALPQWSLGSQLAVVTGVGLLHLAMLFQVSLQQAALLWPLTACVVMWAALRLAHPGLALQSAALQGAAVFCFALQAPAGEMAAGSLPAFAHLRFWIPVVVGLSALLCGAWLHRQTGRLPWCKQPSVQWLPVVWGLAWWVAGWWSEATRVLEVHRRADAIASADVGIVLVTSAVALWVAQRRQWPHLGRMTIATLAGFVLAALVGIGNAAQGSGPLQAYVPSSGWGWLAWPLAALWHLRLLRSQRDWFAAPTLALFHVAGLWLFVLLAARQCQWLLADASSSANVGASGWALLGWVLAPAITLFALQTRPILQRWPVQQYHSRDSRRIVPIRRSTNG